MNFGAELDDDLFETPNYKKDESSNIYIPKVCNSEWFNSDSYNNCEDASNLLKFQAYHLYYHRKYMESAQKYIKCLEMLDDSNNLATKRDCLEGIARSFLHLEMHEEALQYALQLHSLSQNIDQNIVDWNLLGDICHQTKRYKDELQYLQNCLKYHPWNYDFWLRLAFCYARIFEIQLNSKLQCDLLNVPIQSTKININVEDKKNHWFAEKKIILTDANTNYKTEDKFFKEENNPKETKCFIVNKLMHGKESLIVCACLIRAKVLLQTCILGYRSFTVRNNSQQQKQINELIHTMDIEDDFIKDTTQIYLRDINIKMLETENTFIPEVLKNSNDAKISQLDFETVWFGWILKDKHNQEN